jgi:hypothetical protein
MALILAALGKLYLDVRTGNKETAKVHVLVNGHARKQMRTIARLARAVSRALPNDVEAARVADEAEKDLDEKTEADSVAAALR